MVNEVKKKKMFEDMLLLFAVMCFLGVACLIGHRVASKEGIMTVVFILTILSGVAGFATCVVYLGDNIDVRFGLDEGGTYLAKSATYGGDKVTLDLQEINVATNETVGPEFLHKRNAELIDLEAGDIIIYQNGNIRYWVSPF